MLSRGKRLAALAREKQKQDEELPERLVDLPSNVSARGVSEEEKSLENVSKYESRKKEHDLHTANNVNLFPVSDSNAPNKCDNSKNLNKNKEYNLPAEYDFNLPLVSHHIPTNETGDFNPNIENDVSDCDDHVIDRYYENSPYISSESDYIPSADEPVSSGATDNESYDSGDRVLTEQKKKIETRKDKKGLKQFYQEIGEVAGNKSPAHNEESSDDDSSNQIIIRSSESHAVTGKRVRHKKHCCHLCDKLFANLSRHLKHKHSEDTSVSKILALPTKSSRRRVEFAKLSRIGDFYHNCEVLQFKKGELILMRSPTPAELKKYSYIHYGPCPACLGFMLKKHICIHMKGKCPEKSKNSVHGEVRSREALSESNAMLRGMFGIELSADFVANILNKLRDDEISKICKEDELILKFGALQFDKYNSTQAELIRQTMRQVGRFLQEVMCHSKLMKLSDCLHPKHFDKVIQCTKSLCVTHTATACRPEFQTPSLALKIGHAIKKCVGLERGIALKNGDQKRDQELSSFLTLMDLEWSIRISSTALNTLHKRKFNATQLLPLTADLVKLNKFLETEIKKCREKLEKSKITTQIWMTLAQLVLSRIVLFNKRRSGETSRMSITQYLMRPLWSEQTTDELKQSMSAFEKKLAERLAIVEVEGKRGRRVPILLTPDIKAAIDLLIQLRSKVGISPKNPYVFARSNNSLEYLRGHDCIRKFCEQANLQAPENVNGTKLRKYVATVCQVFNLSENETDWLARHLGHDIRVHREFYRLHESAVELTKVSRLLLAVDKGEANSFAGKKLQEIEITDLPGLEEDELSDEEISQTVAGEHLTNRSNLEKLPNRKRNQHVKPKEGNEKKGGDRRPWAAEETETVLKYFRALIKIGSLPGKKQCEDCIEKHAILSSRKWTDIKFHVKNYITKIKKTT